jgi:PhzF family phenazine biosynthesis protein
LPTVSITFLDNFASMNITQYVIDAFASKPFTGNPAAVCLLESWLDDTIMQNIAMENNLAETAFVVRTQDNFHIRWFTPTVEVDLCGHATLASAHAIFEYQSYSLNEISFSSRSGILNVRKENDLLVLNFPADKLKASSLPQDVLEGVGGKSSEIYRGSSDYMLVFDSEKEIRDLSPDFTAVANANARGIIVTAKGEHCDFVSRFFAPQSGINEDPVTGSAHTSLIPYWSKRLAKKELTARQLSKRGGDLFCKDLGERVEIAGKAITYLRGEINI